MKTIGEPGNIPERLITCSRMFGVLPSDTASEDHREILKAMSFLCRTYLERALNAENVREAFLAGLFSGKRVFKRNLCRRRRF